MAVGGGGWDAHTHLFLLQAQTLRQRGQLLLQHRGQHGPALALLVQQAQPGTLLRGRGLLGPRFLRHPSATGELWMEGRWPQRPAASTPGSESWLF